MQFVMNIKHFETGHDILDVRKQIGRQAMKNEIIGIFQDKDCAEIRRQVLLEMIMHSKVIWGPTKMGVKSRR